MENQPPDSPYHPPVSVEYLDDNGPDFNHNFGNYFTSSHLYDYDFNSIAESSSMSRSLYDGYPQNPSYDNNMPELTKVRDEPETIVNDPPSTAFDNPQWHISHTTQDNPRTFEVADRQSNRSISNSNNNTDALLPETIPSKQPESPASIISPPQSDPSSPDSPRSSSPELKIQSVIQEVQPTVLTARISATEAIGPSAHIPSTPDHEKLGGSRENLAFSENHTTLATNRTFQSQLQNQNHTPYYRGQDVALGNPKRSRWFRTPFPSARQDSLEHSAIVPFDMKEMNNPATMPYSRAHTSIPMLFGSSDQDKRLLPQNPHTNGFSDNGNALAGPSTRAEPPTNSDIGPVSNLATAQYQWANISVPINTGSSEQGNDHANAIAGPPTRVVPPTQRMEFVNNGTTSWEHTAQSTKPTLDERITTPVRCQLSHPTGQLGLCNVVFPSPKALLKHVRVAINEGGHGIGSSKVSRESVAPEKLAYCTWGGAINGYCDKPYTDKTTRLPKAMIGGNYARHIATHLGFKRNEQDGLFGNGIKKKRKLTSANGESRAKRQKVHVSTPEKHATS